MSDPKPSLASDAKTISLPAVEALWEAAALRAGDKLRALALGVVAFTWAVLSADKPPVSNIHHDHPDWLLITASLAIISLLVDLLQTLANYVQFNGLRNTIAAGGGSAGEFNRKSFLYRFANAAFWLKTFFCVSSCLSLLILVPISL